MLPSLQLAPWSLEVQSWGPRSEVIQTCFFFNIGDRFQFGREYTISNTPFLTKDELCKTKFIDSQYYDIDLRSFFAYNVWATIH